MAEMQLRSGSHVSGENSSATTATASSISPHYQHQHNVQAAASGSVTLPSATNTQEVTGPVLNGVNQAQEKPPNKGKKARKSATNAVLEDKPAVPTNQRRYSLRQSGGKPDVDFVVGWEALARQNTGPGTDAAAPVGKGNTPKAVPLPIMSRNRPRGPPTNRDNGIAANEEIDMWNRIIQDIRKAKEKNDKQKTLSTQIAELNEKIGREGNSKSSQVSMVFFLLVWLYCLLSTESELSVLALEVTGFNFY